MGRLALATLGILGSACGRSGFGPDPAPNVDLTLCPELDGVTVTRASSATFFDSSGELRTAAPDQPRCAYDPKTSAPIGLLVEGARTNFVTNAIGSGADVDGLPLGWQSQHDMTTTAVGRIAASPTFVGFQECAIAITASAGGGQWYQVMYQVAVPQSDVDYTLSLFVRSPDPSGIGGCSFAIQLWTEGFAMQLGTQLVKPVSLAGAAWNRESFVFHAPARTAAVLAFYMCGVNTSSSSELVLAAPQLEVGGGASSPIPTANVPGNRAADLVTIEQTALLRGDEGTIVLEATNQDDASAPRTAFDLGDTEAASVQRLSYANAAWSARFADTATTMIAAPMPQGFHRVGYRWSTESSAIAVDGALSFGAGVSRHDGVSGTLGSADGDSALFGAITRFRHWVSALDDGDLSQVTAP